MFGLVGGIGIIQSISSDGKASVKFFEEDGNIIEGLQVLAPLTLNSKEYGMPEPQTPVLCIFLGEDLDRGYIISSFYNDRNIIPEGANLDKKIMEYPGGGKIEIDRSKGSLLMDFLKEITIKSPMIKLNGEVLITDKTTIQGALEAQGGISTTNGTNATIGGSLKVKGDTDTIGTTTTEGGRVL